MAFARGIFLSSKLFHIPSFCTFPPPPFFSYFNYSQRRDFAKKHIRLKCLRNILKPKTLINSRLECFLCRCGSPYYVAPEMVAGKGYGSSVDVWSLGVVLYSILTGDVPFSDNNLTTLLEKIVEGKYHIPRYLSEGIASH